MTPMVILYKIVLETDFNKVRYNRTILVTSKSGQVGQGEFNDQFITTTFRPDQREPLGSVITGSRLSVNI